MKYTALLSGLLLAIAAFTYTSCNEDSFSQIVEIDIPEHQPKPVIVSQINAGDTLAVALVSISKGILDTGDYVFPANASVRLLSDDQAPLPLTFNPDTKRFEVSAPPAGFISGVQYRMEVQVPGFGMAYSKQMMPAAPDVASVELRKNAVVNSNGNRSDEILVSIDDPAGTENYYQIELWQEGTIIYPFDTFEVNQLLYIESNDPNLQDGGGAGRVIADGVFDGTRYVVRFSTGQTWRDDPNTTLKYTLRIAHITRDAYLYERTLSQYYNAQGNPFAEPVTVHSNIEDGYGAFRAAHWKEWELR